MTADQLLQDLQKYDFVRAYHAPLLMFTTRETDEAAQPAASTLVASLLAKEAFEDFSQRLRSPTTAARDCGAALLEHDPALAQPEIELGNPVMTLRRQVTRWFWIGDEKHG